MNTRMHPPLKLLKYMLRAGFTLIEMSIALVIIGLVVGGIPDTAVAAGIYCYVGSTGAYATNISTGGCQLDFINAF